MNNMKIRAAFMAAGLRQWQVAAALGMSETHFSRKLRHELPQEESKKILRVIDELKNKK